MQNALLLPLLLFNSFEITHEVMAGFINSSAGSSSSCTSKQQENLIRALGCWTVIIIWDLPFQCIGKVRIITHCNAWYYVREQFEANDKLSKDRKKKGVRALADGSNWLTQCKKKQMLTPSSPYAYNSFQKLVNLRVSSDFWNSKFRLLSWKHTFNVFV